MSDAVLFIDGIELAADRGVLVARNAFNTLTQYSADELLDAAQVIPKPDVTEA